ncbi:MAG: sulfurtransferase [Gammaproteobacteria bacterium]|nr:sulfurtransferase [Gammaproteobacteria bacterium]
MLSENRERRIFTTLIGAEDLAALSPPEVRVFDCRFDLADADSGGRRYLEGHIPGAAYLHLNIDLSGHVEPGRTGRHPLPGRATFEALLTAHGVTDETQVVAYDDMGGMFAARLWWMVRWAGHRAVAVLDGGYQAWLEREGTHTSSDSTSAPPVPPPMSMRQVREHVEAGTRMLLDARASDRFRGENETIDPVAGHIAGALSAPFQGNLGEDGRFLEPVALRRRFNALLTDGGGKPVVCYCGSGVTATHNVLAMVHAGMPEPALYPGSWSEWITDPGNPIAT